MGIYEQVINCAYWLHHNFMFSGTQVSWND